VNTPPSEIVTKRPVRAQAVSSRVRRSCCSRNPYYWEVDQNGQRLPYLDEYVFLLVKDLNTMALKFESGETDLIDPIQNDQVPSFQDEAQKGGF